MSGVEAGGAQGNAGLRGALRERRKALLAAVVLVIILAAAAASLRSQQGAPTTATSTGTTTISGGAYAIVTSAAQSEPAGFVLESSQQTGSGASAWATMQQADGSGANVTVIIYPSAAAASAYYGRVVAGVEGLPGYTAISSALSSFQGYGACYGYGEQADNISVANGVCTKGNAFLQVHLESGIAFSSLEADLTTVMGALYESAN
jgi:hypothetical protein